MKVVAFVITQLNGVRNSISASLRPFLMLTLVLCLVTLGATVVLAQDDTHDPQHTKFINTSRELSIVEDLFIGGSGELVHFDVAAAKERGISESSIQLAEELATHTNALIMAADWALANDEEISIESLDVSLEDYPKVRDYFEAASLYNKSQDAIKGWCDPYLTDAACSCGHWWYPRPSSAAPWLTIFSSNPSDTLTSLGFHETPGWAGGGWTRPQTWYPSRCGYDTFRDHAYILDSTHYRYQSYTGFEPRGEPNPEFWNGGPWPYGAWPTYVQWWHANY